MPNRILKRLPAVGTKDREKLDAMVRLGPPHGAEKRELQTIDGNGGYGTYRRDGHRYEVFLKGNLRVTGKGPTERYWIELPLMARKPTKPDDPEQSKRFIETAEQAGADDEKTLDRAFKKILPASKNQSSKE
jgi:hypothetical protein